MKRKKIITMLIVVVLIASACVGCSKKPDNASVNSNMTQSDKETQSNKGAKESKKEPITFSYWSKGTDKPELQMKDRNDNLVYQELEKISGIHVDFIHPPLGQDEEQFNLMLASSELPDVIESDTTKNQYPGGADKGIKDDVYLRLNELIAEYAPNFQKILDENPEIKKLVTTDEGNIWAFPAIQVMEEPAWGGLMLRGDWLEELGLEVPTTVDEWEVVLRAFKEKKGATPLYLEYKKNREFYGAFSGAYGVIRGYQNENGTVTYGAIKDGYKGYLALMNKWYAEGLLDADYVTRDKKSRNALIAKDGLGAFLDSYGRYGYFDALMKDHPTFKLVPAPYPSLEKGGDVHFRLVTSHHKGIYASLTTSCKNPEEVVKWFDYAYGEEGAMLFNYGVEGITYEMVEGKPVFTEFMTNNPDGFDYRTLAEKYKMHMGPYSRDWAACPPFADVVMESMEVWDSAKGDWKMPPAGLSLTAEEGKAFYGKNTEIETYVDEMTHKFIMGVEPLDKFDDFVKQVKRMGIDDLIKIKQDSLDRYNNR